MYIMCSKSTYPFNLGESKNNKTFKIFSCTNLSEFLMTGQPPPPNSHPPRNKALWSGLINHVGFP